jgi:hypothetical protein
MGRRSSLSFAAALALALAAAAPAAAHASATVSVGSDHIVRFTVDDALDHGATASVVGGRLVIGDDTGIASGSGCSALDAHTADCGPAADVDEVRFAFGAGDDELSVADAFPIDIRATGGAGVDALRGGDGDDFIDARDSPPAADAEISCGAGLDTLVEDDGVDDPADDCEALDPPVLEGALVITGVAQVGSQLALSLPANVGGEGRDSVEWLRCPPEGIGCYAIENAQDETYTPTDADRGYRLEAEYLIANGLGYDEAWSQPTTIVLRAASTPHPHPRPTPRPPVQHVQHVSARPLVLGPFRIGRKPALVVYHGHRLIDTGRSIRCPATAGAACRMSSRASARLRGRTTLAGTLQTSVAPRAWNKLRIPLGARPYRLLRAHHKLTLKVTATLTRTGYSAASTTFTITIRAPAHGAR